MTEAVKAGIVTEVEEATEWLAPAHFVEKPGQPGRLRLVTDFRRLSSQVTKDVLRYPTGDDVWKSVNSKSKVFFKLDATSSYHQVKLSDNAKSYMNFLLPFGKFRYEVGAMGYINSGTEWNRRTDKILLGAPCIKQVDDIMGQGCDYRQLAANLKETLVKCRLGNITLSRKKVEIGEKIHYSGYIVSSEGCFPDPQKVAVLKEFAQPEDQHELRVFLGLTQQMSSFMPDLSHATKRLRGLLQKDAAWLWLPEHQEDFLAVKAMMSDTSHLVPFCGTRKTCVITDASDAGTLFVLFLITMYL